MKLGLFGARADSRGLAYQTASFAKWLQPDAVYGLDLTEDNLSPYPCDWRPYFDVPELRINLLSKLDEKDVRSFLRGIDVVVGAETFYHPAFLHWAKEENTLTVLQVNPEFVHPGEHMADVVLNPSTWRMSYIPGAIHLPFPVDRELFPFRRRTVASKFVHIAGHKAAADRAGSRLVLGALRRTGKNIVTIRSQSPFPYETTSKVEGPFTNPTDLYRDADVVILPRRYGGQSLVANEALSSGCPVIVLDREPDNTWGGVFSIPTRNRGRLKCAAGQITVFDSEPVHLANAIRTLQSSPYLVEQLSDTANEYAATISWDTLLPHYMDLFATVLTC